MVRRSLRVRGEGLASTSYALITGASQGLGRALAGVLAAAGANLALTALPDSGVETVARVLAEGYGIRTVCCALDLTAPGAPEDLASWAVGLDLPVSVLVNNAGVGYNRRFEESTLGENERCILLNNLALVKLTRLLLPTLRRQRQAYILNVASLAAFFPMPTQSVYAPSKAFILNFSLALREELRGSPVSVSVLCPAGIPTHPASIRKLEVGGPLARITTRTAEQVAVTAVDRMLARQAVIVPGLLNRLVAICSRVVPRSLVFAFMARIWGRTAQEQHDDTLQAPA